MARPVRAALPDPDRVWIAPRELWTLGSHHPAQRLARRWLL
jgi:heat shock protein HtpX